MDSPKEKRIAAARQRVFRKVCGAGWRGPLVVKMGLRRLWLTPTPKLAAERLRLAVTMKAGDLREPAHQQVDDLQ